MRIKPFEISGLLITDTTVQGFGVGRHNDRVLFVEGGLPGDVLDVTVFTKRRRFWQAKIDRIVAASPDRRAPSCPFFGPCGGCKWQHQAYSAQLAFKQKQVEDALERIGHFESPPLHPILGAEQSLHYRNKLEFTFSSKRWLTPEEIASGETFSEGGLGFHVAGNFEKVLDQHTCLLGPQAVPDILVAARELADELGLSYYAIKDKAGYLRTLTIRHSLAENELMLLLAIGEDNPEPGRQFLHKLQERVPEINHGLLFVNLKGNDQLTDLPYELVSGADYLTEQLGDWRFRIRPTSFFQTNTHQARRLYDLVKQELAHKPSETLFDLYCGAGSIGIYVSDYAKRIVGVEYVQEAVEDARENARLNGLDHLEFHSGDLAKLLDRREHTAWGQPDTVILDPPRAGLAPAVVKALLDLAPERIIYVSCNPATQARDLQLMAEHYQLDRVQPVDMFPQTSHVECVAVLRNNMEQQ